MRTPSFLKKNLFSLKNNAILHNRVLLYFIFLVSLGNLFYLSVERDITSIIVFVLVGFMTSFFSKNMLIILFVALVTSTILKYGAGVRHEGLENMVDEPDDVGTAEVPAGEEEEDLSNELYLDADGKKRKVVDAEEDITEEEVVENYEDSSKKASSLTACVRKCLG